ncbi:hypothetical protein ElyMa_007009900 [Elysia marginata]|uniref:IBB domain-containing protein n=1 Tax=Elysia marginata TaxID=1093978 RepID=A0AAV4JSJ1_9GAST|nr:hypothetical protein ElyMa_007009900 [Elysia marginata]
MGVEVKEINREKLGGKEKEMTKRNSRQIDRKDRKQRDRERDERTRYNRKEGVSLSPALELSRQMAYSNSGATSIRTEVSTTEQEGSTNTWNAFRTM